LGWFLLCQIWIKHFHLLLGSIYLENLFPTFHSKPMSLPVRCVSCRQQMVRFLTQSVNLCLLTRDLRPLFSNIIERYIAIPAIYCLILLYSSFVYLLV
jgi:hypothetical protein